MTNSNLAPISSPLATKARLRISWSYTEPIPMTDSQNFSLSSWTIRSSWIMRKSLFGIIRSTISMWVCWCKKEKRSNSWSTKWAWAVYNKHLMKWALPSRPRARYKHLSKHSLNSALRRTSSKTWNSRPR